MARLLLFHLQFNIRFDHGRLGHHFCLLLPLNRSGGHCQFLSLFALLFSGDHVSFFIQLVDITSGDSAKFVQFWANWGRLPPIIHLLNLLIVGIVTHLDQVIFLRRQNRCNDSWFLLVLELFNWGLTQWCSDGACIIPTWASMSVFLLLVAQVTLSFLDLQHLSVCCL